MKVLFVCIHNSARSQMAEELLRKLGGDKFQVKSAGLEPGTLNPLVVKILKEEGIDISQKKTQSVAHLIQSKEQFDYVITVCDEVSAERCPTFPGNAKRLHWGFEDPSRLKGSDAQKLERIREIKEEIKAKIRAWLNELGTRPRINS